MARFLLRVTAFAGIQSAILAWVWCYGSLHTSDHYLSAIYDKLALLENKESPRLIFVGGSNVAFGIHCELFKQQLALQPINLGLNAGLGLDFPLRLVEQHVRQGDIVVIIPEYSLISSEAYDGNQETITQLLEQWPEGKEYFDSDGQARLKRFLDHDGLWLTHLRVRRARRRLTQRGKPTTVYVRSNFNRYGDMVGHHGAGSSPLYEDTVLVKDAEDSIRRAVRRLNEFQTVCSEKGAQTFFCYPPIPRSVYDEKQETIAQLDRTLRQTLKIPIAHSPHEATYVREYFFDTAYHLTKAGAEQRSEFLLARLRRQLLKVAREATQKPPVVR